MALHIKGRILEINDYELKKLRLKRSDVSPILVWIEVKLTFCRANSCLPSESSTPKCNGLYASFCISNLVAFGENAAIYSITGTKVNWSTSTHIIRDGLDAPVFELIAFWMPGLKVSLVFYLNTFLYTLDSLPKSSHRRMPRIMGPDPLRQFWCYAARIELDLIPAGFLQ